jgi:glutathione peroxidase
VFVRMISLFGLAMAAVVAIAIPWSMVSAGPQASAKKPTSVLDFTMKDINGKDVPLANFQGKVLLIVNTASQCGFTPQYKGLQELYAKYHDRGLEVLGFPCDQFGHQEPGSDAEIKTFCETNYAVNFPLFSKIEVNGDNAHPLYKFLKSEKGGLLSDAIKWNFTKFLVDKQGTVVERFAPQTTPEKIAADIERELAK